MIPVYLSALSKAAEGRLIGKDAQITEISLDSRHIKKDCLFIAIKGDNFDGHDFIEQALENGAISFVSHDRDRDYTELVNYHNIPGYILVDNTRRALLNMAAYYRSLFPVPVVAVTGSAGKTSVKNGVTSVLSQRYDTLKTDGNFNNEIGLPKTVFGLNEKHQAAVFEMGMNSFGEISALSKAVKPYASIITNVGTAHIEKLLSREGILRAKLEIADGMDRTGTLILNYDNDMLRNAKGLKQNIMWFSAEGHADVYAETCDNGDIIIRHKNRAINVSCEINALPLVCNLLAAASVGFLFGLSDEEIKNGLLSTAAEKGRLNISLSKSGMTIIDDSYNANADSMRLAIDVLKAAVKTDEKQEKIAILGDMKELGDFSESLHKETGEYAAKSGIDTLIAIGDCAKHYMHTFEENKTPCQRSFYFKSIEDFMNYGYRFLNNCAVLVKASRSMNLNDLADYLKTI